MIDPARPEVHHRLLAGCAIGATPEPAPPAIRTVRDVFGTVEVPADARRAATTFFPTFMALAELGVPLAVAARESLAQLAELPGSDPPG